MMQRFVHKLQKRYPVIPIVTLSVCSAVEVASIILYIYTEEKRSSSSMSDFFVSTEVFVAQVCFAIFFVLEWFVTMLLEEFKVPFVLSFASLVSALTCFPMVVVGFGALVNGTWTGGWVPMFLRVWWLHNHLLALLDYPQLAHIVNDLHREMVRFTIGLLATMVTCVGVFQAAETYSGGQVHFLESAYFIVVTFGTIGYGDYYPTTATSRLVVVVIIIVAIYTFPLFFSNLAELAKQKPKYTFYQSNRGRNVHVIIIGSLNDRDVSFFLNEFFSGARRYINLNIVLLSDVEFSQETRLLVSAPTYKDRVTLVLGDCLRAVDLERCDAAYADAAFLVSSSERSSFSDYHIVQRAMAVRQFDGNLPLHVMLKRERNSKFVAPIAKTIMEKERLKFTLLGMATVLPGMIPFVVNLVRTYDPPARVRECTNWLDENEWSMGQELYTVRIPPALIGVPFADVANALVSHAVSLIGVTDSHGFVTLNPSGAVEAHSCKAVVIAEDFNSASTAMRVISEHVGAMQHVELDVVASDSMRGGSIVLAPPSNMDESMVGPTKRRSTLSGITTSIDSGHGSGPVSFSSLRKVHDAIDLQDHFILIDLSSAQTKSTLSPEASEEAAHFKATDLLNVIRPIKEMYPEKEILILARDEPNSYFVKLWKKLYRKPVLLIEGCGLNFHDIRRCNIKAAFGVVIFSSEERSDSNADAMTLLTALSVEEVVEGDIGIPIVTEIDQLDSLSLFPPFYSQDSMSALAEENWAFEPNFIVGNSVCSSMLDPALYQSYFNAELLRTIDALTFGGPTTKGAHISRMRLSELDVELRGARGPLVGERPATYEDVSRMCIAKGLAPVGLHRVIHDPDNVALNGKRFMLTNPPPEMPASVVDDIVYFLTPGQPHEAAPVASPMSLRRMTRRASEDDHARRRSRTTVQFNTS